MNPEAVPALVLYVLLALVVSSICSIFEAVLLSITPAYLAAKKQEGSKAGKRLEKLKSDVDRPLAAILSLNTIAHTVGAAGAGAQAAVVWPSEAYPYAPAVFGFVLTLLILFVSEIVPKSLGATHWRRLAPLVGLALVPTIWFMYPLVLLSRGVTRLLGGSGHGPRVSRDEISAIAQLGAEKGVFDPGEGRILKGIFGFPTLKAADVMTPRTVLMALPESETIAEVVAKREQIHFSRIPIYRSSTDDISGYVLLSDVLLRGARDEMDLPLSACARKLAVVPETMRLSALFETLLQDGTHIALVVDEYGGTAGLVTLEDLVETLIGMEIVDEADRVQDMQELARQQWRKRAERLGILPVEEQQAQSNPAAQSSQAAPAAEAQPEETEAAPADAPPEA